MSPSCKNYCYTILEAGRYVHLYPQLCSLNHKLFLNLSSLYNDCGQPCIRLDMEHFNKIVDNSETMEHHLAAGITKLVMENRYYPCHKLKSQIFPLSDFVKRIKCAKCLTVIDNHFGELNLLINAFQGSTQLQQIDYLVEIDPYEYAQLFLGIDLRDVKSRKRNNKFQRLVSKWFHVDTSSRLMFSNMAESSKPTFPNVNILRVNIKYPSAFPREYHLAAMSFYILKNLKEFHTTREVFNRDMEAIEDTMRFYATEELKFNKITTDLFMTGYSIGLLSKNVSVTCLDDRRNQKTLSTKTFEALTEISSKIVNIEEATFFFPNTASFTKIAMKCYPFMNSLYKISCRCCLNVNLLHLAEMVAAAPKLQIVELRLRDSWKTPSPRLDSHKIKVAKSVPCLIIFNASSKLFDHAFMNTLFDLFPQVDNLTHFYYLSTKNTDEPQEVIPFPKTYKTVCIVIVPVEMRLHWLYVDFMIQFSQAGNENGAKISYYYVICNNFQPSSSQRSVLRDHGWKVYWTTNNDFSAFKSRDYDIVLTRE